VLNTKITLKKFDWLSFRRNREGGSKRPTHFYLCGNKVESLATSHCNILHQHWWQNRPATQVHNQKGQGGPNPPKVLMALPKIAVIWRKILVMWLGRAPQVFKFSVLAIFINKALCFFFPKKKCLVPSLIEQYSMHSVVQYSFSASEKMSYMLPVHHPGNIVVCLATGHS